MTVSYSYAPAVLDVWHNTDALTGMDAINAPCRGGPLDGATIPVLSPRMVPGEESLTSVWIAQDADTGALLVLPTRSRLTPITRPGLRLVGSYEYHENRRELDWLAFAEAACRS